MSSDVRDLAPHSIWNFFADLNEVPRPSKKEERVIAFIEEFGQSLELPTAVDDVGNVLIRKPATAGMEDRAPVILQSHLDMVCQKNAATDFDFDTQGIRMFVEGDWVKAQGTTLGSDNGIGVASIMAILAANDIPHPPLEALFTIDEETGMTGAKNLKPAWLQGRILLNLDTEDDDELTIGCAGGCDVTATGKYVPENVPANHKYFRLTVKGLTGGHSGMDIHLGRGNANKIMNRLLWGGTRQHQIRISSIDGGGLRNAIPRESTAIGAVATDQADQWHASVDAMTAVIAAEYSLTDPDLVIALEPTDEPSGVIPVDLQGRLFAALYGCPCGIHRMSPAIPDLVQTSNNLARVTVGDGKFSVMCLTRSSVDSERDDHATEIQAVLELAGASVEATGHYPGWQPQPTSPIVALMSSLYEEMFEDSAHVAACHAGLECGIIGEHYPDMQMISFGPNIRGAHSPDERAQVSSVQKFWQFLLETLKRIPA